MKNYKIVQPVILIYSLWIGSSTLWSQQAKNVVLADFVSTEKLYGLSTSFPYATQDAPLADLWGWTYNGNEYALVCLGNKSTNGSGLALVKVTDPNKIEDPDTLQIVKIIRRQSNNPADNGPRDVRVFGNYAYVSQDNTNVDNYYVNLVTALNSPSDPFAGVTNFPSNGRRVHNLYINTTNGLLFLSDLITDHPIPAYDINSVTPVFKGNIPAPDSGRSHDLTATTIRVYDASNIKGLTITDYTYASGTFTDSTQRNHFYNARRGKNPNNFSLPKLAPVAHDATVSTNGNYLYSTEERLGTDDPSDRQLAAYLKIWDISTINAPPDGNGFRYPIKQVYQVKEVNAAGSFATSYFDTLLASEFANSIHNVHIRNESGSDIAYISYYTKGLRIVNVANPLSPTEIGWYDTPTNVTEFIYPIANGSWGVYPYFSSGTVLVSDVKGLYVFRRATEVSGTISSNTTWSGAIFVTNNITVNNNATLTIQPGTTVAFANAKSLTVNAGAIIIADGTSAQTIKFTSNSHPPAKSKWSGLTIYSTGNVFDYCTFEYGNNSLRFVNSGGTVSNCAFHTNNQALRLEYANVTASNCEIYNNTSGVILSGQSSSSNTATLINCHIHDNDRSGIIAANWAHAVVRNSRIEQNGKNPSGNDYQGVYVLSNCDLTFYDPDVEVIPSLGLNTIRNNQGAGVYSSNSTINLGIGSGFISRRGDNAVFSNGILAGTFSGKQIYNAAGATVNARWTYWGQGNCPPPASLFSGSVDYANCLTTSPTGFSKITAGGDSTGSDDPKILALQLKSFLLDQTGPPAGFDSLSTYDALSWYFSFIRGDFEDKMGERADVPTVLAHVYEKGKGQALGDKAWQFLIGYKMIYVDWAEAEKLCEQGLQELTPASHADVLATLITLKLRLGKFDEGRRLFDDYAKAYPEEKAMIEALQDNLATAEQDYEFGYKRGLGKPEHAAPASPPDVTAPPAEFYLSPNFPNPFNPETEMRFGIPAKGHVTLRIYNILGVEVRKLVEGTLENGNHRVIWEGRDNAGLPVVSGIYLYRITYIPEDAPAETFTHAGKMSLLR